MAKIRGRFAPLFEELGNDHRWLIELNDFEKFIFQLILCAIYWGNGEAPDDARYYQRRFNLKARPYQIRRALDVILLHFHKIVAKDKKLSLLNYKGYENRVATTLDIEGEIEIEGEGEAKSIPSFLKQHPYKQISGRDFEHFYSTFDSAWLTSRLEYYASRKDIRSFKTDTLFKWLKKDYEIPTNHKKQRVAPLSGDPL